MKQTNKVFQGDIIFYISETNTSTTKEKTTRDVRNLKYYSKI